MRAFGVDPANPAEALGRATKNSDFFLHFGALLPPTTPPSWVTHTQDCITDKLNMVGKLVTATGQADKEKALRSIIGD